LSGFIAFALTPLGNRLARWMPHPVALGLAYVLGVGTFLGFSMYAVATTAGQVTTLVADLPGYAAQLQQLEPQVTMLGLPPESLSNIQQRMFDELEATGTTIALPEPFRL